MKKTLLHFTDQQNVWLFSYSMKGQGAYRPVSGMLN